MLQKDFEALFESAQQRAERAPKLFRLRVTLRASRGVGSLFGLSLAALLAGVWSCMPLLTGGAPPVDWQLVLRVLLIILAIAVLVGCVRVLRGGATEPEGIVLPRDQAPRLFEMLDRMTHRFGAPCIHEVRVTGDLNVAIMQQPGWCLPLCMRNTLVLGLPLALAVTPRQFVAVLAHEFGHLRRQRTFFGGWGAYTRACWHRLLGNMESVPTWMQPAFAAWSRRESPAYCAESLALSHLDELEADEAAACVVGAHRLGRALAEIALKHRFLAEDYWRRVYAQADHAKLPSFPPYRYMGVAFRAGFDREIAADWLDDLIDASEADPPGTHPTLRTRVRALGLDEEAAAELATESRDNAARRFFGDAIGRLAGMLDRQWWDAERVGWRRRHWEVSRALERIARLEREGAQLGPSDRLELAMLIERYDGDRDPLMAYRDIVPEASGHPEALLAMGRLLLNRGDPSGAIYLRRAQAEDDAVGLQAAELLLEYFEGSGDELATSFYRDRLAQLLQQAVQVQAALDLPIDALRNLSPGLEMFELRSLVRQLRQHDPVLSAYITRRRTEAAPLWRAYLLVICVAPEALEAAESIARDIEAGIAVAGLWRVQILLAGSSDEALLHKVRGSKIYSRRRGVRKAA